MMTYLTKGCVARTGCQYPSGQYVSSEMDAMMDDDDVVVVLTYYL
jgi:hypothetical protein